MCETKCLIFPKLDSKNIYILIFVFASLCQNLIPKIVETIEKKDNNIKPPNSILNYFDIISFCFSDILAGIIVLKNKLCSKENHRETITSSEGAKTKKNMRKLFYLIIPLISMMNFLGNLCLYFFYCLYKSLDINEYISQEDLFFMIFFDILFRYIFSRIFLKSYFYKHHYFSIFLNVIGLIPLIIISSKNIFEKNISEVKNSIIIFFLLYFFRVLIFSLRDIFTKISLNKLLLRPYHLMFYKALFELIPISILSIPAIISDFSYIKQIFENALNFIIYRVVYIICGFFLNYSYITIIELINPNHLSILKSLEFIAIFFNYIIWTFIEKENVKYINHIFEFISFIILLFGACIYNEMIVIKKCGLYECTDYYKTEVKGFSNIDIDLDGEKNVVKETKDDNSLIDNSSINYIGD